MCGHSPLASALASRRCVMWDAVLYNAELALCRLHDTS